MSADVAADVLMAFRLADAKLLEKMATAVVRDGSSELIQKLHKMSVGHKRGIALIQPSSPFTVHPPFLFDMVSEMLPRQDLARFEQVCKRWMFESREQAWHATVNWTLPTLREQLVAVTKPRFPARLHKVWNFEAHLHPSDDKKETKQHRSPVMAQEWSVLPFCWPHVERIRLVDDCPVPRTSSDPSTTTFDARCLSQQSSLSHLKVADVELLHLDEMLPVLGPQLLLFHVFPLKRPFDQHMCQHLRNLTSLHLEAVSHVDVGAMGNLVALEDLSWHSMMFPRQGFSHLPRLRRICLYNLDVDTEKRWFPDTIEKVLLDNVQVGDFRSLRSEGGYPLLSCLRLMSSNRKMNRHTAELATVWVGITKKALRHFICHVPNDRSSIECAHPLLIALTRTDVSVLETNVRLNGDVKNVDDWANTFGQMRWLETLHIESRKETLFVALQTKLQTIWPGLVVGKYSKDSSFAANDDNLVVFCSCAAHVAYAKDQ